MRVSQLRKALGQSGADPAAGPLLTRGNGYLLRVADDELDSRRFEQALDAGSRALAAGDARLAASLLDDALLLWRGSPLTGVEYEPFAQREIARLEELRLVALEVRIDCALELGEHARAVGQLESLVRAHPLRERFRAQLMLALYRSGRQAEALASYRDARQVLAEELGLEPGDELERLEAAILRQDPALEEVAEAPATPAGPAPRPPQPAPPATALACPRRARPPSGARSPAPPRCSASPSRSPPALPHELIVAAVVEPASLAPRPPFSPSVATSSSGAAWAPARQPSRHRARARTWCGSRPSRRSSWRSWAPAQSRSKAPPGLCSSRPTATWRCSRRRRRSSPGAGDRPVRRRLARLDGARAGRLGGTGHRSAAAADRRGLGRPRGRARREPPARGCLTDRSATDRGGRRAAAGQAGPKRVMALSEGAGLLVVGLSERWRDEGLGRARSALLEAPPAPLVLVRRGERSAGAAPPADRTRFGWSLTAEAS